jgi:hypothetical protein
MERMSAFRKRWAPIFGGDPGFETIEYLYDETLHDWDDDGESRRALDASYYERARALGHDTSQRCPDCKQQIDQVETIWDLDRCFVCEAREENEIEESREQEIERKAAHERWYASLSPIAREIYDAGQRLEAESIRMYGLITRDVQ